MNEYRITQTTVSLLNYHFVFCPRYRRKIFQIPGVEARFKELIVEECAKNEIEILNLECHTDYVHIFVNCLPTMGPNIVMQKLKGATSAVLRKEFPELSAMPSLWTRSYFVSTAGTVPSSLIKKYVEEQKSRY